jgi:CRP/FNR family cyclic AMP-dependent transcriptional regulator
MEVDAILRQGFLSCLEPARQRELIEAGHLIELVPAQPLGPSVVQGWILVMLNGLLRVFLESPAGRQVTVRYARPGDALGLVHLFGAQTIVQAQAIDAVRLWALPGKRIEVLAHECAAFALAIARECADRTVDAMEELRLVTFGTVRQRLSRHLLDLATCDDGEQLKAVVTQRELADAAGTVREVVARTLKEMRDDGLVGEAEVGIALLDPRRLDDEAAGLVT